MTPDDTKAAEDYVESNPRALTTWTPSQCRVADYLAGRLAERARGAAPPAGDATPQAIGHYWITPVASDAWEIVGPDGMVAKTVTRHDDDEGESYSVACGLVIELNNVLQGAGDATRESGATPCNEGIECMPAWKRKYLRDYFGTKSAPAAPPAETPAPPPSPQANVIRELCRELHGHGDQSAAMSGDWPALDAERDELIERIVSAAGAADRAGVAAKVRAIPNPYQETKPCFTSSCAAFTEALVAAARLIEQGGSDEIEH